MDRYCKQGVLDDLLLIVILSERDVYVKGYELLTCHNYYAHFYNGRSVCQRLEEYPFYFAVVIN